MNTCHRDGWAGTWTITAVEHPTIGEPEAVSFGNEIPITVQGNEAHNLFALNNRFGRAAKRPDYGLLDNMVGKSSSKDNSSYLKHTMMDTLITERRIQALFAKFKPSVAYPNHPLGISLSNVASLISAEIPTRGLFVSLGGFDTHQGQVNRHQSLLKNLSTSLLAFQKDLQSKGLEGPGSHYDVFRVRPQGKRKSKWRDRPWNIRAPVCPWAANWEIR